MKLRYRILILLGIFIISLFIFYRNVEVHTYVNETNTVKSGEPTLPVISFLVDESEINTTLGLTFIPEESLMRESITPLTSERSFEVLIDEKESNVKRLTCTVMETATGNVVEEREIMALKESEDGRLYTPVILTASYATNVEYIARITLTTGEGRYIYYYTRILIADDDAIATKLSFSETFHTAIMDYDTKFDMEEYLETTSATSGSDYSVVTLADSIDVIGYGDMKPVETRRSVPKITEYNSHYMCVSMDFWVDITTNDALETFYVNEAYRYFSEGKKNILYNYTRTMNAEFDGTLVSINKNQIKLGLTTETELNYLLSDNEDYLLYVHDTALWEYDMVENDMVCVFTLRDGSEDERTNSRAHDYKLISIDDEGNADFVLYGYITQGEYEGRVGILYYRYYADEKRLEEMMFVPVTVPYGILAGEFGDFVYMNDYDEFYFTLYDSLYLYRTLVNDFSIVAEHLSEEWIWFPEQELFVYQEAYANEENTKLIVYDLENRVSTTKNAPNGERILLLGTIDSRIVYGLAKEADITFYDDGTMNVPMYALYIEEITGEVVKTYTRTDEYIAAADVENNIISIELSKKTEEISVTTTDAEGNTTTKLRPIYVEAGEDIILNIRENASQSVTVAYRTTDLMHREYYLDLPESFKLEKVPKAVETVFTVLTNSTSVRVGTWADKRYYVAAYGEVIGVTKSIGEAIAIADANMCSVYDGKGQLIWLRGAKQNRASIKNLTKTYEGNGYSNKQAVLQMLFDYKGIGIDARECDLNAKAMLTWLDENMPGTTIDLTGANLSEILMMVSSGKPVVALYEDYFVLITGYTANTVTFVDPKRSKTYTLGIEKAKDVFDKDSVYFSYID